ncbi:RNA polymerase sigma factor [Candidatus Sumerlaeota bacterium]|nr:RNA polymerase sigma factor [Candidatus Sumerlaeota bacterium]
MRFTDEQVKHLLRRALSNDETAWRSLFDGLYGLLKSQAIRAGLRDEDVDDSVGEILLSLVTSPQEFLEARDVISYLAASAYFAALRQRKVRGRIASREFLVDDLMTDGPQDIASNDPRQQKLVLSGQIRDVLLQALSSIPEPVRNQLLLHYGEDLSYEEIAYICGSSSGGIRVAVHRALARLRVSLENKLAEPLPFANIGHALRSIALPSSCPQATPEDRNLLEDWILDADSLAHPQREQLERRLEEDSTFRLLRALTERAMEKERDVRGHAVSDHIPPPLLDTLMDAVEKRRTQGVTREID